MEKIASKLECLIYTSNNKSISEKDREAALKAWISLEGLLVIIVTSALGIRLNYLYVR